MGELTEEEKQILELLRRAEERRRGQAEHAPQPPSQPPSERFVGGIGLDAHGRLNPLTRPPRSPEEVKESNLGVLRALQEAEERAEAEAGAHKDEPTGPTPDRRTRNE